MVFFLIFSVGKYVGKLILLGNITILHKFLGNNVN